ncbi:aminodeoxychorismate lyase [Halorhodospira abdelmalekii]|uniref:aminodeoxychorismate lyase n=1 Tax=Halorhodospira abdelmalekii TaxID=421629 RepID=UPI001906EFDC|nr:aminodeoxychorismate lyase [Halorhodospira abdelmalekii]MBK1734633.1 aminodeoxychorismate lyase [Halorhodospira abdelmalekii]
MRDKQLVNGRTGSIVDPGDRGLIYGDGLFETVAVRQGRLCLWNYHMDRLLDGARRIGLPEPPLTTLREEARYLVRDVGDAVLKILYTRGPSEQRGYLPPVRPLPTRILSLQEPSNHPAERWHGVHIRLCQGRFSRQPALAGIKHLNRLEQVMARSEWRDRETGEGLMLDDNGLVISGTATNVFAVQSAALITPPLDQCGVAGVMRRWVLELAPQLGLRIEQRSLYPEELSGFDELFVTNSLIGLWPVRSISGDTVAVGPVAQQLLTRVAAETLAPDEWIDD